MLQASENVNQTQGCIDKLYYTVCNIINHLHYCTHAASARTRTRTEPTTEAHKQTRI